MSRFDEHAIAELILAAPGWVRVGITAPTETLRHAAAIEMARLILSETSDDPVSALQLAFAL